MKPTPARNAPQSGQAMVEFLVAMMSVMSVLMLAVIMLAKFNDVRNRTLMGSRYAAWERTVWTDNDPSKDLAADASTTEGWSNSYGAAALAVGKTDSDIKGEVLERIMAGDGTPVSGTDRQQSELAATQPAMWHDYGGNALLASASDVQLSTDTADDPASSQTVSALATWQVPTATGTPFAAHFALPTRTLRAGTVSVAIAQDSSVLKRLWPKDNQLPAFSGLTFSDTNVLMTNTWVPDGSNSNRALFSQAVPAANVTLVPPNGYQSLQKYAPEISTLQFGRIQQDVVPPNRLSQ
uniref:Transmembrane protein n=1 Tax=Burkholderia sp. (strain CCGE1003) TaxID=640512 RepID=E1TGR6_BURSG